MYNDDCLYWIWLAEKCGIASKDFSRLIDRFDNPFEIYRLDTEELGGIDCIGERLKCNLAGKSLENAYSIMKYCKRNGVDIITYGDNRYPSRLKTLEDPPVLLYCLGKFPNLDQRLCIGVVGTRKISAYGMETAYKMSYELASARACIVSGMALGIDAVAACAALEARGDTIAVLGSGIDVIYPKEHKKLYKCIAANGAVITEYPPYEPPLGSNFPKRNRIISGISQGVLVIEGNRRSGAIITAERAIAQGRDVFALPGKINESNSEGTNDLIRNGANVVLESDDIIVHYDFLYHDTIDYKEFKHSKSCSQFKPKYIERYGVSSDVYYVGSQVVASDQSVRSHTDTVLEKKTSGINNASGDKNTISNKVAVGDDSAKLLLGLDAETRKVFELMPLDRAIMPDELSALGVDVSQAMISLTILEVNGLVISLPGGLYTRK